MTEVPEESLEVGKYYLFWKKYEAFNPDIYIGEFVRYCCKNEVACKNFTLFQVQLNHQIRVITDKDGGSYDECELSSMGHSECWCFELDDDEVYRYIMEKV